jgi:thioredoxin-related protein
MKKIIVITGFVMLILGSINAQDWETNMEVAQSKSEELDRNIVLVFQGSDWCAPCIKLDREIWQTEEFRSYANENYILLKADFPRKKKNKLSSELEMSNNELAEKYNKQGYFPLVVVLNHKGKVLGTTGYKKTTPSEYIKLLSSY